jgi:hypothetical protein
MILLGDSALAHWASGLGPIVGGLIAIELAARNKRVRKETARLADLNTPIEMNRPEGRPGSFLNPPAADLRQWQRALWRR